MLHPGRVERRPPSLLVIPRELKVVALARHADGDVPDTGPGVQPGAQRVERTVVRGHGAPGEADSRTEELGALVEHAAMLHQRLGLDEHRGAGQHALLDHLVGPQQQRLRDREPERLRSLRVDDQLELDWLLDRKVGGFCALEDFVDE